MPGDGPNYDAAGKLITGNHHEPFDSWAAMDLGPYVRGEIIPPEPTVGLLRSDGLHLLYPGREHAAIGEMEAGKSWFAVGSVAHELQAGHHVVYVHFEEA